MRQFKAESKRLLGLMIDSIYTHKEIFLREIVSNASDAIDKLAYRALTDDSVGIARSDFAITIEVDKDARTITVTDNGIGMTAEELDSNLGVIARSGSGEYKAAAEGEDAPDIIGQFGVGFYSAFMVADSVTVYSRAFGADGANVWQSKGAEGYTVKPCEREQVGTSVVMHVKPDTEDEKYSEFLETWRLRELIKKYSDYIAWPIKLEGETVNSMKPIWQRAKSEVSDEDCAKFYKEKYYDTEDPAAVIRVSAEGIVSYKAMLFIPSRAPYNYYMRDYKAGLSLYSNGVMIMEKCTDLLPECFRFVQGVVDSADLSLNISREMLQHDRQLRAIASNLEKKVKNELEKMMKDDREKYEKFFAAFGLQLKYGVVSGFGEKRELLRDLLLFPCSGHDRPVSLAEYAAAMPEGQPYIYWARGDSAALLERLPQAELVRDAGYEVLYLTEEVDEFVVNALGEQGGKELRSVTADDLGLPARTTQAESEKRAEEAKDLLDFVKETLGGAVAEARLTDKLKSWPACIAAKGPISIEMERYFNSLPGAGEKVKAERVLELNPEHPVYAKLREAFETDRDRADAIAHALYFEALLVAGVPLDDPAELAGLINELLV
jgi:molecular chaperone HtpG